MQIANIFSGTEFDLYAIVINGQCLFWDFYSNLEDNEQTKVFALLKHISDNGPPHNETKFRNIGNKIYEIKTRSSVRCLCFFGGSQLDRSIIITHAFHKPHTKILKREKNKALNWLKEYLEITDIKDKIVEMEI